MSSAHLSRAPPFLPLPRSLQACPPSVFPFYGLTPAMLRAMSNPATIQANIQATINATSRQQHRQEQLGGECASQLCRWCCCWCCCCGMPHRFLLTCNESKVL